MVQPLRVPREKERGGKEGLGLLNGEGWTGKLLYPGTHTLPMLSVGQQCIFQGRVSARLTLILSPKLDFQQGRLYLEGWDVSFVYK